MRRLICVNIVPAAVLCAALYGSFQSAWAAEPPEAQATRPAAETKGPADPAPPFIEENCPDSDAEKNLYVVADEIVKDKNHPLVQELKKLAKYRAGLGSLREFEGKGIPETPFADFELTFEDRASALAAQKLFPEAGEPFQDVDGYRDHEWVVPLRTTMPKEAIGSLKKKLKDNGLMGSIMDYLVGDIVIFGRCLNKKTATLLQRKLAKRKIKSRILIIRWVETDI